MCISNSFPELRAYQPTAEEIQEEQRFYQEECDEPVIEIDWEVAKAIDDDTPEDLTDEQWEAYRRFMLRREAAEAAVEMSDSPETVQGIEEGYEDLLPF